MAKSNTPKIATKKHLARVERERKQVNLVLIISSVAIALAVLLVGYGILQTTYLQYQKPVAVVNGEKITLKYWQERVQFARLNLSQTLQQYQYYQQFGMDLSQQIQQITLQLQSGDAMGDQVLTQLIDEALIRQEAQKRGITVTDAEVDAKLKEGFNFYPNGTPSPTVTPTAISFPTLTNEQMTQYPPTSIPTEAPTSTPAPTETANPAATVTSAATATSTALATPTSLPQLPTSTATPYTLEGYKNQYATTVSNFKSINISEATLRSVYLNQIYREKLMAEVTKDTPRTEEQVLARHILVPDVGLAATIEAELAHGGDFAELAKKYSQDTSSATKGGELDWATRDTFVKEFADAAFSQPIGEIGQPVKSQYGYHIIQVIARENLPVSDSQYDQLKQKAFTDWLTKLHDDTQTAKNITTDADTWKANIPALPASVQQILQQQAAPQ